MARSLAFYRKLGLEFPDGAEQEGHVEAQLPGGLRYMLDTEEVMRMFDRERAEVETLCPEAGDEAVDVVFIRPPPAGRAQPAPARKVAHDHPLLVQLQYRLGGLRARNPRHEGALARFADHLVRGPQRLAAVRGHRGRALVAPVGSRLERCLETCEHRRCEPARIEPRRPVLG